MANGSPSLSMQQEAAKKWPMVNQNIKKFQSHNNLRILWSAVLIYLSFIEFVKSSGPISSGGSGAALAEIIEKNDYELPNNVSVRMSTSIVESANYRPPPPEEFNQSLPMTTTTTYSLAKQRRQQQEEQSKQAFELEQQQQQQRGSRFFRSQDTFPSSIVRGPMITATNNQKQNIQAGHHHHDQRNQRDQPIAPIILQHSAGKILDFQPHTSGYSRSVSTSRNISPASPSIQVLSPNIRTSLISNRPLPGGGGGGGYIHTRDKIPYAAEHKQQQPGFIRRIIDGSQQALLDIRCEGRGVGKMLKSAKNMLQHRAMSSVEEHSGFLMLGSSLLAATIPLAVLYSNIMSGINGEATSSSSSSLTSQQSNRRASSSLTSTNHDESPLTVLKNLSLQTRVDSMMGWIERSVEHLPSFPRLHPQECVKRSICEAHNEPNRYGAIGFILRLLFPATTLSSTDRMDNMDYKVINKYRHAAGFGLNKRIDSNGTNTSACREKYEDCLISLLDVARNMMDIFLR